MRFQPIAGRARLATPLRLPHRLLARAPFPAAPEPPVRDFATTASASSPAVQDLLRGSTRAGTQDRAHAGSRQSGQDAEKRD